MAAKESPKTERELSSSSLTSEAEKGGKEKSEPKEGAKLEELQDYLDNLEKQFSAKRKEQSEKHIWTMIAISIAAFVLFFFLILFSSNWEQVSLLSLNQDNFESPSAQNVFIDRFQTALVLSLAVAIIPLIVFSANRSRKIQRQNDELAALNQDILRLRNKILLHRQEEVVKERTTNTTTTEGANKNESESDNAPKGNKIGITTSESEAKLYPVEKAESEVPKQYDEIVSMLYKVAKDHKLLSPQENVPTRGLVTILVSSGKVQEEALQEFGIIERTRNKQENEGAVPEDEYGRFILAVMRLKTYLETSYQNQY